MGYPYVLFYFVFLNCMHHLSPQISFRLSGIWERVIIISYAVSQFLSFVYSCCSNFSFSNSLFHGILHLCHGIYSCLFFLRIFFLEFDMQCFLIFSSSCHSIFRIFHAIQCLLYLLFLLMDYLP